MKVVASRKGKSVMIEKSTYVVAQLRHLVASQVSLHGLIGLQLPGTITRCQSSVLLCTYYYLSTSVRYNR